MRTAVSNAGMIILGAFLPKFFERLGLLQEGMFVSEEAKHRAVFLLQYTVYGAYDFPEYHLVLNKLLVGMHPEDPLESIDGLTEDEKTICVSLLDGVIANWEKVANSTYEAIQESFLQREGLLELNSENNMLKVEQMGIDVLVRTIPWTLSLLEFPWMDKPLYIEW